MRTESTDNRAAEAAPNFNYTLARWPRALVSSLRPSARRTPRNAESFTDPCTPHQHCNRGQHRRTRIATAVSTTGRNNNSLTAAAAGVLAGWGKRVHEEIELRRSAHLLARGEGRGEEGRRRLERHGRPGRRQVRDCHGLGILRWGEGRRRWESEARRQGCFARRRRSA